MIEEFEGITFTIIGGYFRRGKKALHRMIWEKFNGPIPKGHHIHHKDRNKLNNSVENLECLSHAAHLSLHMKENGEKLYAWHKSEEGRKYLGLKASKRMQDRPFHKFTCPNCNKEFESRNIHRVKYCGINCQQDARRKRGDDNVFRKCLICGKEFEINRYHKTRTCGYKCGDRLRRKDFSQPMSI